jgi:hypothetical protein
LNNMDSTKETTDHIHRVRELLRIVQYALEERGLKHDASKLQSPEKEAFDKVTDVFRGLTYGSPEYKEQLAKLKPALDHHYEHNSHHPEHYGKFFCNTCFAEFHRYWDKQCPVCGNGSFALEPCVADMSLLDIVEMFCDWKAATERHADGSLERSIRINTERFKLTDQLSRIFENTRKELGW